MNFIDALALLWGKFEYNCFKLQNTVVKESFEERKSTHYHKVACRKSFLMALQWPSKVLRALIVKIRLRPSHERNMI